MKTEKGTLSAVRLARLRAQGYTEESDLHLSEMAFGIRFAYRMCVSIIILAMITHSTALFVLMSGIAFLGMILPKHPFDYVYNYTLSKWMKRTALPRRSRQLKFACSIATIWLVTIVYLMLTGYTNAAMVMAGLLAIIASFPSTIDYCIPSVIYNALFLRGEKNLHLK